MYLFEIFKSKYCVAVGIISLILGYLLLPKGVFSNPFLAANSIVFVFLFSLSITCIVRNFKEHVVSSKGSILSAIATALGFTAMQTCLVSGVCGVNLAVSILATVFPTTIVNLFTKYGIYIFTAANLMLLMSLYNMKCFSRTVKFVNYLQST